MTLAPASGESEARGRCSLARPSRGPDASGGARDDVRVRRPAVVLGAARPMRQRGLRRAGSVIQRTAGRPQRSRAIPSRSRGARRAMRPGRVRTRPDERADSAWTTRIRRGVPALRGSRVPGAHRRRARRRAARIAALPTQRRTHATSCSDACRNVDAHGPWSNAAPFLARQPPTDPDVRGTAETLATRRRTAERTSRRVR